MSKTPQEKRAEGEALIKAGKAKIAEAERDERTAKESQKSPAGFYPKKQKPQRLGATQICSDMTQAQRDEMLKKLDEK